MINYAGVNIQIILKKIKHTYLRVKPDGSIQITANKKLDQTKILQILETHLPKLKARIELLKANKSLPENILQQDSIYYLGKAYPIQVVQSEENKILFDGSNMQLKMVSLDSIDDRINLINQWYLSEAKKIFQDRFNLNLEQIKSWKVKAPMLKIRQMHTRWGSYSKKTNTVYLNLSLIKAPTMIIDYVIYHELTHILHLDHSKNFYNSLAEICPNWFEQRKELKLLAKQYLEPV